MNKELRHILPVDHIYDGHGVIFKRAQGDEHRTRVPLDEIGLSRVKRLDPDYLKSIIVPIFTQGTRVVEIPTTSNSQEEIRALREKYIEGYNPDYTQLVAVDSLVTFQYTGTLATATTSRLAQQYAIWLEHTVLPKRFSQVLMRGSEDFSTTEFKLAVTKATGAKIKVEDDIYNCLAILAADETGRVEVYNPQSREQAFATRHLFIEDLPPSLQEQANKIWRETEVTDSNKKQRLHFGKGIPGLLLDLEQQTSTRNETSLPPRYSPMTALQALVI